MGQIATPGYSNSHCELGFIPKDCVSGILPRLFAAGTHQTDRGQEPLPQRGFFKIRIAAPCTVFDTIMITLWSGLEDEGKAQSLP